MENEGNESLLKTLLVPGIVCVVLIVAVIIMNILIDNKTKKTESKKTTTTTTTTTVGRPDVYGADYIISDGLYNYDDTSDGGIIFYIQRNENDLTLFYQNENVAYVPVRAKQELIKNEEDKYVEKVKFELDDVNIELTALNESEVSYKDSDSLNKTLLVDNQKFNFEGIYQSDKYTLVIYASDFGTNSYEFLSYIYGNGEAKFLDLMSFDFFNNQLPEGYMGSTVALKGNGFNISLTENTDNYTINFDSTLSQYNGIYKKIR